MKQDKDFITRVAIDYINLGNVIKRQEKQIEIMKSKNEQLEKLVAFLKDRLVEYDPAMKAQFDALQI